MSSSLASFLRTFCSPSDARASSKTSELDYAILSRPKTVHDLLLQNGEGAFQLIVCGERVTGEDPVRIRFGSSHPTVKIYDPTVGTEAVKALANVRSLDLTLGDHPLIVVLAEEVR